MTWYRRRKKSNFKNYFCKTFFCTCPNCSTLVHLLSYLRGTASSLFVPTVVGKIQGGRAGTPQCYSRTCTQTHKGLTRQSLDKKKEEILLALMEVITPCLCMLDRVSCPPIKTHVSAIRPCSVSHIFLVES